MKAITCTQCGAAVENVSDSAIIVVCEYCGARMMMSGEKPEPAKKPLPKVNQDFASFEAAEKAHVNPAWVVGLVSLAFILIPTLIFGLLSASSRNQQTKDVSTPAPWPILSPAPFPSAWNTESIPTIKYQTKVSWTGPNDMEHFDEPEIDLSKAESRDAEQIKKTIFKNRQVTVRVTINEDGEVTEAVPLSGHPLLKDACVAAAKGSLFSSRSKSTTRVLTYYFRLISE